MPDKRVALAIAVSEEDEYKKEHSLGTKFLTIPAHHEKECKDIHVKCIPFVLPEENCRCDMGMCQNRKIKSVYLQIPLTVMFTADKIQTNKNLS